jgi:hypothetical protein
MNCCLSDKSSSVSTTMGVPWKKSIQDRPNSRCRGLISLIAAPTAFSLGVGIVHLMTLTQKGDKTAFARPNRDDLFGESQGSGRISTKPPDTTSITNLWPASRRIPSSGSFPTADISTGRQAPSHSTSAANTS